MGQCEDIVLEMLQARIRNYNLRLKIVRKKGGKIDVIKYEIQELYNLKRNIQHCMTDDGNGIKDYIQLLNNYNKKLQIQRNKIFNNIL